jgi:hypothetical protein
MCPRENHLSGATSKCRRRSLGQDSADSEASVAEHQMNGPRRPEGLCTVRDERGQIIILVLGILVVVGILVGALASLATPIFAHATVVRNLNDTVAATDAGLQYGIQFLQTDFRTHPDLCSPAIGRVAPSLNLHSVAVNCTIQSSAGAISQILLTSTSKPGNGVSRVIFARAVVQVNNVTGATTIMSWRTCQEASC